MKSDLNLSSILTKLRRFGAWFVRYRVVLFFLLVGAVYGYVVFEINTLNNAEPSSSDVSATVAASKAPHIDPDTINKIKQLQDNSVSVQTLFDQARQNPFQE